MIFRFILIISLEHLHFSYPSNKGFVALCDVFSCLSAGYFMDHAVNWKDLPVRLGALLTPASAGDGVTRNCNCSSMSSLTAGRRAAAPATGQRRTPGGRLGDFTEFITSIRSRRFLPGRRFEVDHLGEASRKGPSLHPCMFCFRWRCLE